MGISISFYPLNPNAEKTTAIYVSISNGKNRERFPSGQSIPVLMLTKKKKGNNTRTKGQSMLKPSSENYLLYDELFKNIESSIRTIYLKESAKNGQVSLSFVKSQFQKSIGYGIETQVTILEALERFISINKIDNKETRKKAWSRATIQIFSTLKDHLNRFNPSGNISSFDHVTANKFVTYLIETGLANSSVNKYLTSLKTFMRWCIDPNISLIQVPVSFEQIGALKKGGAFKVALKEEELEKLISINLEKNERLGRVRDLFVAQCLTGQRISDIHKAIDRNNIRENSISIIQQKTGQFVEIPIYPRLRKHLDKLFTIYPERFPAISDQKVNEFLKELFEEYNFDRPIKRVMRKGNISEIEVLPMYKVISSHDGRRTFCTLSRARGIQDLTIMMVSGHKKHEQFLDYITVDQSDVDEQYNKKM